MAVVDFELAWLRLKAKLGTKRSWGADQVLLEMSQLEVETAVPEGERDFDRRPAPFSVLEPTELPPAA